MAEATDRVDMRKGQHRVVEVHAGQGYGSGYAVADDLVLTAWHVVAGGGPYQVRQLKRSEWLSAEVEWECVEVDAALLRVAAAPWRDAPDSGALRWGRAGGGEQPVPCTASGFPVAQRTAAGGRDVEDMRGTIDVSTTLLSGRYSVEVTSAPPQSPGMGASGWRGMSGAVLLGSGQQLLGMIIEDPLMFGSRRLEAVPVTWLLEDAGFADRVGVYAHDVEDVFDRPAIALDAPGQEFFTEAYVRLPEEHSDYQLLKAVYHQVPFLGRDAELDQLRSWWHAPGLFSVAVVLGDGGAGKTRLAAQLCQDVATAGWSAGFAGLRELDDTVRASHVELVWPTLLVIDGDLHQISEPVSALIGRLSRRQRGPGLRILLLDRTPARDDLESAPWWRDLNFRTEGAVGLHALAPIRLRSGGLDADGRARHAREALIAFGGDPAAVALPDLTDDGYQNPLKVHLSTLLALRGELRETADKAVSAFVRRERARWQGRLGDHGIGDLGRDEPSEAVALVTLTSPSRAEVIGLLTALPWLADPGDLRIGLRERISRWLAELFPGEAGLAPLAPDLLAEQLLDETADLAGLVLAIADHPARTTRHLLRMIGVLQLGSGRPKIGTALHRLVTERLDVLVEAAAADYRSTLPETLDAALQQCAEMDPAGIAGAAAGVRYRQPVPDESFARLRFRIAALAVGWYETHPAPEQVDALTDMVAYGAVTGDLTAATEAARTARALAVESPLIAYNLGTCLAITGDLEHAVPLLEEAARDPRTKVDALINLSATLAQAGQRVPAARTYVAAVNAYPDKTHFLLQAAELFRAVTRNAADTDGVAPEPDPDGYRPPHGTDPSWREAAPHPTYLLDRLAARLAIGSAKEVPGALRAGLIPFMFVGMAKTQARRAAENYSEILRCLAGEMARQGRYEAATVPAKESVALLRRFPSNDPTPKQMLARNLALLAEYSYRAGRRDDAIRFGRDAVADWQALLPGEAAAYTAGSSLFYLAPGPALGTALTALAKYLQDADQAPAAVEVLREARELYQTMSDAPAVAELAHQLGLLLATLDRAYEAVEELVLAVDVFEDLAAADPAYALQLSEALKLLSGLAGITGPDGPARALAAGRRAVEVAQALAATDQTRLWVYAEALLALSSGLQLSGDNEEALDHAEEAVEVCRGAADIDPSLLGFGLSQVASCAQLCGRQEQAMAAAREAVAVLANVPDTDISIRFSRAVAFAVSSSGLLIDAQPEQALSMGLLAIEALDSLADTGDGFVGLHLLRAEALSTVAGSYLTLGDPRAALAAASAARASLQPYPPDSVVKRVALTRSCLIEANCLLVLGRPTEAREPAELAESLLPGDAEDAPAGSLAVAAGVLIAKGVGQVQSREAELGAESLARAIALLRGTAGDQFVQRGELVRVLALRASAAMDLGWSDVALADSQEALALYRAQPEDLRSDVVRLVLNVAGTALASLGRLVEALALLDEAVALSAELIDGVIPRSVADVGLLAQTFIVIAECRAALGDLRGAIEATAAGDQLLGDASPTMSAAQGTILVLQARLLSMLGEPFGVSAENAATALRRATPDEPMTRFYLAQALGLQTLYLAAAATAEETLTPALEAIELYREFHDDPQALAELASLLRIAGNCAMQLGKLPQAVDWLRDSTRLFADLAADDPQLTLEHVAAEAGLALALTQVGEPADALQRIVAAVDLAKLLVNESTDYAPVLGEMEDLHAQILAAQY